MEYSIIVTVLLVILKVRNVKRLFSIFGLSSVPFAVHTRNPKINSKSVQTLIKTVRFCRPPSENRNGDLAEKKTVRKGTTLNYYYSLFTLVGKRVSFARREKKKFALASSAIAATPSVELFNFSLTRTRSPEASSRQFPSRKIIHTDSKRSTSRNQYGYIFFPFVMSACIR